MLRSIYLLLLKHNYIYHLQIKNLKGGSRIEQPIDGRVFERYREYLAEKNTIRELWTSILYTLDVVTDWIFVVELYQQWQLQQQEEPILDDQQEESYLHDLFIPSLIFAILGTILYLFDAFDVFQWLNLCSSGNAWKVTFCNFMLEDLPQMVITGIAAVREEGNIFTATIIINLMTSSFALITKCVAIQESRENHDEELIFPNLHSFVKKNKKLAEILAKEDIPIFPGKLERLINDIDTGKECQTKKIRVKTNMPGGVIALVQSFENIKQAEIIVEFRDGSIMSTLEVSHLAVKMIEMKDVTWKLDLRECSIGTCTASHIVWGAVYNPTQKMRWLPWPRLEEKMYVVYEGNTIFGLQLLLRQTGLLLRQTEEQLENETIKSKLTKKSHDMREHKIQVFFDNARAVRLENIVLDKFVIKGLCHVLKFATNVSTLTIINDYNNGTTKEEAGNQFEMIKEQILRFELKHITCFFYSYDNNRTAQWNYHDDGWKYHEDGGITKLEHEELTNHFAFLEDGGLTESEQKTIIYKLADLENRKRKRERIAENWKRERARLDKE